jgi:hypothetical protein
LPNKVQVKRTIKYAILLISIGIIAGLFGYGFGLWKQASYRLPPELCNRCHSMQQQVAGWKSSGHKEVLCQQCHAQLPISAVLFKSEPLREDGSIKLSYPITNEVCTKCHTPEQQVKMPGDLINPHGAHKIIECVNCHKLTGHSEPKSGLTGPFKKDGNPSMLKCLSCHDGIKAPNKCSVCHKDKQLPKDHDEKNWVFMHGTSITTSQDKCDKCHGYDTLKETKGSYKGFNLSSYKINGKVNCRQCHLPGHEQNWEKEHISAAQAQGPAKCQSCHSLEGCNRCHKLKNTGR